MMALHFEDVRLVEVARSFTGYPIAYWSFSPTCNLALLMKNKVNPIQDLPFIMLNLLQRIEFNSNHSFNKFKFNCNMYFLVNKIIIFELV